MVLVAKPSTLVIYRGQHQGEPLEMEAEAAEADDVSEEQTEVSPASLHYLSTQNFYAKQSHVVFQHTVAASLTSPHLTLSAVMPSKGSLP